MYEEIIKRCKRCGVPILVCQRFCFNCEMEMYNQGVKIKKDLGGFENEL